jgi:hypothetical protein
MKIAVAVESDAGEWQPVATPDTIRKMVALGAEVAVEPGGPGVTFGDPTEGDGQESRQTFRIADPPTRRCLSETTLAVQNPAGAGRHQAVPLHDKHVFDMHVLAAVPAPPKRAVIGADRSRG